MATQLSDDMIQKLIDNVRIIRYAKLVQTVNVLRAQKDILPPIELQFLEACENEIKRRTNQK